MEKSEFDLIVIGGGAAGFFGSICAVEQNRGLKVLILEKSTKLLSKVKVSGGGRCNVTHHCFEPSALSQHYPRGQKPLKQLFRRFQASDVVNWFRQRNVTLITEEDGRMFPSTHTSQTIIDCFLAEQSRLNIQVTLNSAVTSITRNNHFEVTVSTGKVYRSKRVMITSGGHPNTEAYHYIKALGHTIVKPIPSLFTFNDPSKQFNDLMGVSVTDAEVKIAGSKFVQRGPLLITHWGLSGPAVIKLSAWAAEYVHDLYYQFTALVSWIGSVKEEDIRQQLQQHKAQRGKQKVKTNALFQLPSRLWEKLCAMADIGDAIIWAELPQKNINKLIEILIRCPFDIKGKTTFKEEFVTCGGVDLQEINLDTMQSKLVPDLFFAGEVLNIDGETGGFNFQAAWSTAYIAACEIAKQ